MPDSPFSLRIDGMHCGGCVRRVQQALADVPGVTVDKVEVGRALGTFDPADTDVEELVKTIGRLGFSAQAAPSAG
ncbi:MAG: heavy-metal-associated domain-containing protein [Deltaproteobacteria bacterium]|nr:heavy-metal-associated domain-containing protein [Deltaproteobacteria bacterium]